MDRGLEITHRGASYLQVGRGGGDVGVVRTGELAPTYNVLLHMVIVIVTVTVVRNGGA